MAPTMVTMKSVTSPLRTARGAFFVLTNLPGLSLDHPHESFGAIPRSRVVACAQIDRRALLSNVAVGIGALFAADRASALSDIPFYDDRSTMATKVRDEAVDEALPFAQREGILQYRADLAATKARATAGYNKMTTDVAPLIAKDYWGSAREELRLHIGTLRQDINNLAAAKKSRDEKKAAQQKADEFFEKTAAFDYALAKVPEKKNKEKVLAAYDDLKSSWSDLEASILG